MNERERREKLEKLANLDDIHVQVIYYRCQNKTVGEITDILKFTNENTIWNRFTKSYKILGVKGWKELVTSFCPIFQEFVTTEDDWKNWGNIRGEILRQAWELPSQSETEVISASTEIPHLEHVNSGANGGKEEVSKLSREEQENNNVDGERRGIRVSWPLVAIPILLLCLLCISGGVFGWRFFQPIIQNALTPNQPSQAVQTENTIPAVIPETNSLTSTYTDEPTTTSQPTITSTFTYTPSPIPSETPAPYYSQNAAAELKPGVFLSIDSEFGRPTYVRCFAPRPGYSLKFNVNNNSGEQFLLRFNWYDFKVEDDQGREYEVQAAGIDSCSSDPGLRSEIIGSGNSQRIFVTFAGEIGTNARYLLVTVENISGYGPFVFRKDF